MSKIAIKSSSSGTATFTIESPATNTDRTLVLPDVAGTVFVEGQALSATTGSFSGNVTLGSSVLETPTGSAPAYLCRAWVNFNGTGTVAIRASGNVSSITDNGVGYYTVNFATAMPDANYSAVVSDGVENDNWGSIRNILVGADPDSPFFVSTTTTSFQVLAFVTFGTYADISRVSVAVFR